MAGTVTPTFSTQDSMITKIAVAWVSSAGGAVSGNASTIAVPKGRLLQVQIVPDAGGTQPSDLYDLTLIDTNSIDLLNDGTTAHGSNLSNSAGKYIRFSEPG